MKRLLCIVSSLNQGGAETFLMKLYRNIDRENYQFDFCLMSDIIGKYEDEVLSLGGKLYRVTPKSQNPLKCFLSLRKIVKENDYKYVMVVNEHSLSVIDLIAAKSGGAKKLVMRSSNADSESETSRILHKMFAFLPHNVPNVMIAPSTKAARYTFGKKNVESGKVSIVKNGLPVDDFVFDASEREAVRKELNIENNFVVGHVGRFQKQKNHKFLVEIFKEILKKNENARLVLVGGNGDLMEDTKNRVRELGIEDKVLFLGNRTDVPKLLSAFDVLVFPSFFEGMPNVVIESQAASLPCVISDTITDEADITGMVEYYSLEKTAEEWAEKALLQAGKFERKNLKEEFYKNGYAIKTVVEKFAELVF